MTESFVFMKVGQHAGEEFDAIIERKIKEIKDTGMSFWGYGGQTCHPTKQVQPFAKRVIERNGSIFLYMETIKSFADPDIVPATMFSVDGINYQPIQDGIKVTGSRYAIVLDEIQRTDDLKVPLSVYEVACGNSRGKLATDYLKGRVDKACLELNQDRPILTEIPEKIISFVAKMKEPFAVFVK